MKIFRRTMQVIFCIAIISFIVITVSYLKESPVKCKIIKTFSGNDYSNHKSNYYYEGEKYYFTLYHPIYGYGDVKVTSNTFHTCKIGEEVKFDFSNQTIDKVFTDYDKNSLWIKPVTFIFMIFGLVVFWAIIEFLYDNFKPNKDGTN